MENFEPHINLRDGDIDIIITTYNTAVTDTVNEILGKERRRKMPWVTRDILDLYDDEEAVRRRRSKRIQKSNKRLHIELHYSW